MSGLEIFRSMCGHFSLSYSNLCCSNDSAEWMSHPYHVEMYRVFSSGTLVLSQFTSQSLRQACVVKPICNGFLCGTLTPADEVVIEVVFAFGPELLESRALSQDALIYTMRDSSIMFPSIAMARLHRTFTTFLVRLLLSQPNSSIAMSVYSPLG